MKRLKKNQSDGGAEDLPDPDGRRDPERKSGLSPMQSMGALLACLILLSVLFSVSVVLRDPPSDAVSPEAIVVQLKSQKGTDSDSATSQSSSKQNDKFLGGLLAAGFDDKSCLSRYGSALFRKESPLKPSPYLISKLRNYETLHKKCGPNTEPYKSASEKLKSKNPINTIDESDCRYVVWISFSGLGNRILTLASTFLYALLTDRVLLVDPGVDMTDLFCEPFPETSWFLPLDFPLKDRFSRFDQSSEHCYGNILKNSSLAKSVPTPFMYLHLVHDYSDHDKLFFCDENQASLNEIPWLVIKTDNYFTPSLFLIPSFEEQLQLMFPQKDTPFHFLGRYLLHPTDPVWGLVSRYYLTYLHGADEKIGIQIRVFDTGVGPFQHVLDQILNCTMKEKILPEVEKNGTSVIETPKNRTTKVVLMTSLNSGYYEKIRDMYWENPTLSGEVVRVLQPSHEEFQQTEKQMHNMKAWSEMYLLSLTDVIVTSAWSTFGYVAQGLGGLKPWIMYKADDRTIPDPACRRAVSMEPCFHAPPFYDCKAKRGVDTGEIVPHVRHCEDMSWGLKLVDRSEW